ncbi:MAG: fibronectin type III domain-containing protein [Planctomycetes bacterium]|nr:fibronectin type III domain-containing protein [Planctomycetota bacterium]
MFVGAVLSAGPVLAQAPAPPVNLEAKDSPGDIGEKVDLTWTLSPDDDAEAKPLKVISYRLFRKAVGAEEFEPLNKEPPYQVTTFTDDGCTPGTEYVYRIVAVALDGSVSAAAETAESVIPDLEYFDGRRGWYGVILLIVCGAVIYFIEVARSGKELKVRKIAGLEAFEEAVGRATEMGRPCLFVPGILDINDMQTIAGLTVLSNVARLVAEYDATIKVPTCRSLVMTTARETVEASYLAAGRPDAYNEDDIYYITDEQFGYVAGVTGMMVREKPAACFYMGAFFAESLILAETGNSIGAIQVAGTAMPSQLPFFVAACDFTLIGEEFFAASAYLSGEAHQLGSLKGQDVGKVVGVVLLLIGSALATFIAVNENPTLVAALSFLKDNILGAGGFLP